MFEPTFYSDFLSNLLATIIGIALGLPVAFWFDRIVRSRNEIEKKNETKERIAKILNLLLAELQENKGAIDKFHEDVPNNFYPVRTESWNAFSDGGELQWLNDPELLGTISSTYALVNQYHFIFDKYAQACFFPLSVGSSELKKRIFNSVIFQREKTQKQISNCIDLIKLKLNQLLL